MDQLKSKIRHVPDFPKPGILFYDITTLLGDPAGLRETIDALPSPYAGAGIERVVGIESRGFILGLGDRRPARRRLRPDPQARASCRRPASASRMRSSTAPTRWRSTATPSAAGSAC